MPPVVLRDRARRDLLAIWRFIADRRDVATADRVLERISSRIAGLAEHPDLGPSRPEIGSGARALLAERWLVLYRIDADAVRVVRVVDAARDLRRI